jgi:hypothetical protein
MGIDIVNGVGEQRNIRNDAVELQLTPRQSCSLDEAIKTNVGERAKLGVGRDLLQGPAHQKVGRKWDDVGGRRSEVA